MKALDIIRREYLENIRKKSFIVSTVLVPVFMLSFLVIPFLFAFLEPSDQIAVAVLDRTGVIGGDFIASLTDTLEDGRPKYVATDATPADGGFDKQRDILAARVSSGEIGILIDVPEDAVETGMLYYITKDIRSLTIQEYFEDNLDAIVLKRRLEGQGLAYEQVRKLTAPVVLDMQKITKSGAVKKARMVKRWSLPRAFSPMRLSYSFIM